VPKKGRGARRAPRPAEGSVEFSKLACDEYRSWESDLPTLERLNRLIEECRRSPSEGSGKPEPLKDRLSGWWSRRITGEHRLVYRYESGRLSVAQCRYHY
jgi:toxin YoeB